MPELLMRDCHDPLEKKSPVCRSATYQLDISKLSGGYCFRSAFAHELTSDTDFFRRPLRPEDVDLIDFARPLTSDGIDALQSLMSQRLLLSVNEGEEARPPVNSSPAALKDWRSFYDPGLRGLGRRVREDLEGISFHFLEEASQGPAWHERFADWERDSDPFWKDLIDSLAVAKYLEQGSAYLLIQAVPLWKGVVEREAGLAREVAAAWSAAPFAATEMALEAHLRELGLGTGRHCYWQFYLPGWLAIVNLLHRLGRSPVTVCEYAGARLVIEEDRLGLRLALGLHGEAGAAVARRELIEQGRAIMSSLEAGLGAEAPSRAADGAGRMSHLLELARRSLKTQLAWLSGLSSAARIAAQISAKIERDAPGIDRDRFVEPREMCSTTHVHDEHRLVVIERGEMVFWGNVGMRHEMRPGDMILVPKGRLHGSTVLSQSCAYHQPIIPEDWRHEIPAWNEAGF